ncbi:hypothetical protein WA026_019385 [Henosepilachna vigintioctopunctata]|uniref:Uncharacterized protein n=1 Tax=Henosepilachna vigintioctopunctata TaxID=420089 RepID=A0AAW1U5D4_9CUCU
MGKYNIIKNIREKVKNNNLILTKANKGNTLVCLKKEEYVEKMEDVFSKLDISVLQKDPTCSFLTEIETKVQQASELLNTIYLENKVIPMSSEPPELFGLVKVNKDDLPVRPVDSFSKAPSSNIMSSFEIRKFTAARRLFAKIEGLLMSGQYLSPSAMDQTNWTAESECRLEETCFQLLKGSVVLNKRTAWGDTPLHIACSEANSRCIEGILDLKPNTNIQNQMLYTPLNVFIDRPPQNESILRKLLDAGANPNIAEADGYSPLHTLALQPETGKTRIFARLLVEYKANVNSTNNFKETPLYMAIEEGNEGLVDILLESGASIDVPDVSGRTPMDIALAKRSRHPRVFETMSKHLILRYYCGFPVNLAHLEEVFSSETSRTFKKKCEEEIQQLRSTLVGDSTLTFYDVLVSSTHAVARFLFNVNVLVSLQAFDGRKSVLGPVLNKKFNEALERFHVLQIGIVAARKIFPFLPDICIYKLVEYLDIDDFINLHECFSSRSQI